MKKIFIYFIVIFSCLSPITTKGQSILLTNKNDKIDQSENVQITPDLFPKTSHYMHDLNMKLVYALKPALDEYKAQKVSVVHKGFTNFLKNLREPLNAINSLLQLDFTGAGKSLGRFVINTTAGIGGVMDVAGEMGIKREERDFGQTLGVWGVPMGGFFVMPLYAQTTTRDFAGTMIDSMVLNPLDYYISWGIGLFLDVSIGIMNLYENYDFIIATNETAIDSYEVFKTMYLQHRQKMIEEHQLFFKSSPKPEEQENQTNGSYDYDFDMEIEKL